MQLVTAPSRAARSCFLGMVASCQAALGLGGAAPLEAWYPTPAERRSLVTGDFGEYFNRGASAATYRGCSAGSDSACTGLLRSLARSALPRPLGYDARSTLVHVALRLGGRDAYRRLLADPAAPIGSRLATTAGMREDSLVVQWRAAILAARPDAVAMPPWGTFIALAWMMLFAGCGLRSSRWRVA